jgi:hypothetical protein
MWLQQRAEKIYLYVEVSNGENTHTTEITVGRSLEASDGYQEIPLKHASLTLKWLGWAEGNEEEADTENSASLLCLSEKKRNIYKACSMAPSSPGRTKANWRAIDTRDQEITTEGSPSTLITHGCFPSSQVHIRYHQERQVPFSCYCFQMYCGC